MAVEHEESVENGHYTVDDKPERDAERQCHIHGVDAWRPHCLNEIGEWNGYDNECDGAE